MVTRLGGLSCYAKILKCACAGNRFLPPLHAGHAALAPGHAGSAIPVVFAIVCFSLLIISNDFFRRTEVLCLYLGRCLFVHLLSNQLQLDFTWLGSDAKSFPCQSSFPSGE